ncbi:MAG: hypothetical protein FWG12_06375 [Holophagaceae bacterium]|nr:hypothetical protein [Holophagaceae bacterium]
MPDTCYNATMIEFDSLLAEYGADAIGERGNGARFVGLMLFYLLKDSTFSAHIADAWIWENFEGRQDLGRKRTGIDIVALTHGGEYWAIRCLSVKESHKIRVADVASFLALSAREFRIPGSDGADEMARFSKKILISTTDWWTRDAEASIQNHSLPIVRIGLSDLRVAKVDWRAVHRSASKTGRSWGEWAKDLGDVALRLEGRIATAISGGKGGVKTGGKGGKGRKGGRPDLAFEEFLSELRCCVDPTITKNDAVEMLAQHIVASPAMDALSGECKFSTHNPVSKAMNEALAGLGDILDILDEADSEKLDDFCDCLRSRVSNVKDPEGRRRFFRELSEKLFLAAFPKLASTIGEIYTPAEVVDFVVNSVNDVLNAEFRHRITDEGVNVLDPFAGTGIYIARLIQSGLIDKKDLPRKYKNEIFANDVALLAYYIACSNIECAYRGAMGLEEKYEPFEGIAFTDTFRAWEEAMGQGGPGAMRERTIFGENTGRILRQNERPITVILGSPPQGRGPSSIVTKDGGYPLLDGAIADTYDAMSEAEHGKAIHDGCIRAFRYATDRIGGGNGIICLVSNGSWLDSVSAGFRKSIEKEFSKVYVFNLRGNARTSGELRRQEAGNVLGSGFRAQAAITLLVKRAGHRGKAQIYYRDIGNYLSKKEKLELIGHQKSFLNSSLGLARVHPNEFGDWIAARHKAFRAYIPLAPDHKFDLGAESVFVVNSRGIETDRDAWVYNFSRQAVENNMRSMVEFYNSQIGQEPSHDRKKISWSSSLLDCCHKGKMARFEPDRIATALYRPFTRNQLYLGEMMIHRRGQFDHFFPNPDSENLLILVPGIGAHAYFSCLIASSPADLGTLGTAQCFPLYWYEAGGSVRRDCISSYMLRAAQELYGSPVTREEVFYYVYGILHHSKYRKEFASDLQKSLPRIPLVNDYSKFQHFSWAGWQLAELHLNFENQTDYLEIVFMPGPKQPGKGSGDFEVPASGSNVSFDMLPDSRLGGLTAHYVLTVIDYSENFPQEELHDRFRAEKIRHPKKGRRDAIIFNKYFTITDIPDEAYEYVVNGKPAIEWVMERYQVKIDKDSGIVNDPNLFEGGHEQPDYILSLLLSVIAVSIMTTEIVKGLPEL